MNIDNMMDTFYSSEHFRKLHKRHEEIALRMKTGDPYDYESENFISFEEEMKLVKEDEKICGLINSMQAKLDQKNRFRRAVAPVRSLHKYNPISASKLSRRYRGNCLRFFGSQHPFRSDVDAERLNNNR